MNKQSGLSLIELMVAISIGAVLMAGLVATFQNSSNSRRELEKSGLLIENGRYAIDILYEDLRHAGYYGHYYALDDAPATLPDPCETGSTANLKTALPLPIQGYRAANLSTDPDITDTNTCETALLTAANLKAGSDILIVRRADTELITTDVVNGTPTWTPTANEVYIQSNSRDANIMFGSASATVPDDTADNNATTQLERSPNKTPAGTADTRKYRVHVYFVAPCSYGSGTNEVCTATDDGIPTLKRLELTDNGSGTTVMDIVPLVEGIEYLKVEYGIDNNPATVNTTTGYQGDGVPDIYKHNPTNTTMTAAEWPMVVSVKVYILARSTEESRGYTDLKTYTLASVTAGAFNDSFKRHVYSAEVRPVNLSGRREVPE